MSRPAIEAGCALDRSAALLAFGTRAAIIVAALAATTFAAITPTAAASTASTLAAVVALATRFAAALEVLSAFAARALLITGAAVLATVSALSARAAATASTTTSAVTALALVRITSRVAGGPARGRGGRLIGVAAEDALQPAEEAARLLLGLGALGWSLIGLIGARLEFPFVTARFTRFEGTRLTGVTPGLAWLVCARLSRFTTTTFTGLATGVPGFTTAFTRRTRLPRLEWSRLAATFAWFAATFSSLT